MAKTTPFRRDLSAELPKHFKATPDERVREALALGRELFEMHLRTLPPAVSRDEAGERLRLTTHAGRRPSRVMSQAR
jgi:hypothetical protein